VELKISVAPTPAAWGKSALKDFYRNIAESAAHTVFVGETICSKRDVLSYQDLDEIASILREKGKKVYYSSLALLTTEEEFERIHQLIPLFDGVEANTIGILNLFEKNDPSVKGKDLVIGPYLNIYNWQAAQYLKKFQPARIVAPFEIPHESIDDIIKKTDIPMEILAWGHLPTAISWRCYTARSLDLTRENCGKVCFQHPDGMLLKTVDDNDLFIINGLQVLSAKTYCLVEQLELLDEMNIKHLRIEASKDHGNEIINTFSAVLSKDLSPREAMEKLAPFASHGVCNGWFWKEPGWKYVA
jgi:collagenase-like PrtC family protease